MKRALIPGITGQATGWRARIGLEEGLRATYACFLANRGACAVRSRLAC